MRCVVLKVLIIVMGVAAMPSSFVLTTAYAEEPKTCADGKPCPTDAELEDSCSDEAESI
tara:strand:- start:529 stop:705 length:177 start_codon:yes stop_codon:yes gene_type:complete